MRYPWPKDIMARQIEAYQSDGKGGIEKVLIDEPDEQRIEREKQECMKNLAAWLQTDPTRLDKLKQLVIPPRKKPWKPRNKPRLWIKPNY